MARSRGKAKARNRPSRPQPVQAAPPPPPPPPPPAVEEPPPAPEEADESHASRAALIGTIAVVAASTALTFLLLSGWTPGPHTSTPQPLAAAPAAKPKPKPKPQPAAQPKPKPKPKKKVVVKPPTATQLARESFQGACGFCHTLEDAGTTGRAGPNLDKLKPTRLRVLDAINLGGRQTGLMPPDIIEGTEASRVANYVAKVTRR